ncbi:hypothetical protein V1264_021957 [Littorina saxatilis]|uniref:Uncharacterized protein n=1 Tax=Littorina saxatilis TaxID=31220 RepID=A0AAN9AJ80_9CAEN
METEPSKPKNRTKRKERAHQLNQEKQNLVDEGFSGDEGEGSPPRSSKEKNRSKPRRQRNNSSHSFEEDVIDGFAIMSFKTLEDLEILVKSKGSKAKHSKVDSRRSSLSPSIDGERNKDARCKKKTKKVSRCHIPACCSMDLFLSACFMFVSDSLSVCRFEFLS